MIEKMLGRFNCAALPGKGIMNRASHKPVKILFCRFVDYGYAMKLFEIFKGKDPERQEAQGDLLFKSGAFGQAKLEYESAVEKLRKETANDARIPELDNKILRCREALAAEHRKRGEDLVDGGYFDEAREYYSLALDLTQDEGLKEELRRDLRIVESRQAEVVFDEPPEAASLEPEIPERVIPEFESEDECVEALFNALPDELRDIYMNYGENFKTGCAALHQGRFKEAVDRLSLALDENPAPDSYVRLELATAYLNLKRHEEALALLNEFAPRNAPAMTCRMLCEIYWETGSYDRALAFLESLPEDQHAEPFFCELQGGTLYRAGKHRQAESLYLDFLRKGGWDRSIGQALAETYEAVGDYDNARELYGRVISSCMGCRVTVEPEILRKYADLSMETGIQDEKILEIYLGLAEKDPENAASYYGKISRIYAALGHAKESRRFQQIALRYQNADRPDI